MPSTTGTRATSYVSTSQGKGQKKDTVANPNHAYLDMLERWELCNDLMGGTPSMRAAGEKWLRKFPKESPTAYKNRLAVTTLFNVYGTTIQTLVGRVFREPVSLTENTDPRCIEWASDIDRQGRDLNAYARDCLTDLLVFGKCHTMPEFPNTDQLKEALRKPYLDLADERMNDVRPYFAKVSPMSLIGWDGASISGREMLARIRVYESHWRREGEWSQVEEETIRVVYPDHVQIWTKQKKEGWVPGPEIATTLGEVNLTTGYARRTGFLMSSPVLEDLAWLNHKHWNSQSDQDNILHVVRAAILLLKGFTEDDMKYVEVGSSIALRHSSTDVEVKYVEHTGAGIEAGSKALADLVDEMQASGAGDLLTARPGNETATARAISEARTLSPLQAVALYLQDHLEESFKMAGRWIGEPDIAVGVRVNTDLGSSVETSEEIKLLQADAAAGRISNEDYLREAQARGLYDSEVPLEDLLERAREEQDAAMPDLATFMAAQAAADAGNPAAEGQPSAT